MKEDFSLKLWVKADAFRIAQKVYENQGRWRWADYASALRGPDDKRLSNCKFLFNGFLRGGSGGWICGLEVLNRFFNAPSQYASALVEERQALKENSHYRSHILSALEVLEEIGDIPFKHAVRQLMDICLILVSEKDDALAKDEIENRILVLKDIFERNLEEV